MTQPPARSSGETDQLLRTAEEAVAWKDDHNTPDTCCPVFANDLLFTVADNGVATCYDAREGNLKWRKRLKGEIYKSSPVAADGHIFFTTEAGAIVVVRPGGDFVPLAINELGEDSYATPAFADGRIYVRTSAALYAFGNP